MFERLLEFFFHAKAGALAGLILIGTTGALVTATVSSSNNVTTITLTQASASPSGSASPTTAVARTASPSPTVKPTNSPSSSPASAALATTACTTDTQAMSDAVHTVNTAFSMYHTDLMHMRGDSKSDAAKKIVENTDKLLKTLRQNAVKDIHATSTCAKAESDDADKAEEDAKDADKTDEDKTDENDDSDKSSEKRSEKSSDKNFLVILFNNLFGSNTNSTTATTSNTTTTITLVTTGDPKAIADSAVAAMKLAFEDASAQLKALPTPSPKPTKAPQANTTNKDKGGSHGKDNPRADREDD